MKKLLFVGLMLMCVNELMAQTNDTITIYYDAEWKKIDSKEGASFYGKVFKGGDGLWEARDYYLDGVLQMKGTYLDELRTKKQGAFEYYHENEQLSARGVYEDGEKEGLWTYWYENGQLKSKGSNIKGNANGVWIYWDETGELKSKGSSIKGDENGVWTYWYEDGKIRRESNFKGGKFDGELRTYWENGTLKRHDVYESGKLKKGEVWDSLGKEEAYYDFMIMPEFKGGERELMKFIYENIKYPSIARENGIEGQVVVWFIVEKDGTISNIKIKRNIGGNCGKEAVRIVKMMPKWKPGMEDGKPVRVSFNLPVRFKLTGP